MPINIFGGRANVLVGKVNASIASIGFDDTNVYQIFEVGNSLKSWVPGRPFNPLTQITEGMGYYIIAKIDMDLTAYFIPPNPEMNLPSFYTGHAITTTNPPNSPQFQRWITVTPGTYTNFKDITNTSLVVTSGDVDNGVVEFWGTSGVWEKVVIDVPLLDYILIADAVAKTDIVDNILSTDETKVLSAKQGKVLSDLITAKVNASALVHNFDAPNTSTFADTLATKNKIDAALATALNSSYKGNASPTTNPGVVSTPQYWTATEAGTYTNFGGVQVTGDFAIIYFDGVWKVSNTDLKADTFIGTVQAVRNLNSGAYSSIMTSDNGGGVWQLDAADTTSADNTGTTIVTTNGKRYKRIFDGPVQLDWFGGKSDFNGTTGTDNLAAINAIIALPDVNVEIGTGRWFFSGPYTLPNTKNVCYVNYGELIFPATSDGPKLESSNTNYRFIYINKGIVRSLNSGSVSGYTGIGLSIKNCFNRYIEAGVIWNFGDGIKIFGEGASGSQYNKIHFDRLVNCKTGIRITATSTGDWCNQNQFYCGEVRCYDGVVFDRSGLNTDPFNGNIFYGLGIEQCTNSGLTLDFCQHNSFFGGRTAAAENPATYLFNFSSTAKFNTFFGYALYEADVQSGIRSNNFIGPIYTPSGVVASTINVQGLNLNAEYSSTAFSETVNNIVSFVATDKENVQFANVKTKVNGVFKTRSVEYKKEYFFANTANAVATLPDPIGFIRVNSSTNCSLTIASDELNAAYSKNEMMFFVDVRTAVTTQILSGIDASVLVASSLLPGVGFYQVIYSQADWKVWRLDRDTSGGTPVLIGRNAVAANMQVGTTTAFSLFLGANNQDQLRLRSDGLGIDLLGFFKNPTSSNNGNFSMPDTGAVFTVGSTTAVPLQAYLSSQTSILPIMKFTNFEGTPSWINRQGFFKSPVFTGVLDFPSVPANSESAALTVTVAGAGANDFVLITPNANTVGIQYKGFVTATDTVSIYACNFTGSAVDPSSGTFRVTVIKAS